jgi:hypothetical protein
VESPTAALSTPSSSTSTARPGDAASRTEATLATRRAHNVRVPVLSSTPSEAAALRGLQHLRTRCRTGTHLPGLRCSGAVGDRRRTNAVQTISVPQLLAGFIPALTMLPGVEPDGQEAERGKIFEESAQPWQLVLPGRSTLRECEVSRSLQLVASCG